MKKTCIIIAGPTASGKTSIGLDLARHYSTEIISADSRQCYKELQIGVAKPTAEELQEIPHYFINSHSVHDVVSASSFEKYALSAVQEIFLKNDKAVMVGGTGLYIKTFCEGLDIIPEVDETIRNLIISSFRLKGIEWLQNELKLNDTAFFEREKLNPQRMIRALEVKLSTGKSIIEFQTRQKIDRGFNIIQIGLEMERNVLYERINKRVDDILIKGLEQEALAFLPISHLNALQTVGYTEFFEYFKGIISRPRAIDLIKQNSRHYAKRQMTWFRRQQGIKWFKLPDEKATNNIINYINLQDEIRGKNIKH